jgi:DNA-binding transcriptional ArsR family regulator
MLHILAEEPQDVGTLAIKIGVSQPNASQHLSLLRAAGLVLVERHGREIRYHLSDKAVMSACDIMRGFLERHARRLTLAAAGGAP